MDRPVCGSGAGIKALADPTGLDNASLPLEFAHVLFDEAVSTSSEPDDHEH
jgi:hypothetical protein